jgi:hypothetical protein
MVNGFCECLTVESREAGHRCRAIRGSETRIPGNPALRRFIEGPHARPVKRFCAAVPPGETPGATNLFGQGSTRGVRLRRERPKSDPTPPQPGGNQ